MILILAIVFAVLLCLPAGPVNSATNYIAAEESISLTDFRNKTIRVKKPVNRIVCLIESALSGLYMLGAREAVVGISTNVYDGSVFHYYAALDERIRAHKLPAPGNWDFVNIESVISLRPDLVIIWSQQTESIRILEERGVPVFGVFIGKKEDVYAEIEALGRLTGRGRRAEELIGYTKKEIATIERNVKTNPFGRPPHVYYMWAQGNLETSCGGSTVNDLIALAGGKNVCSHVAREHAVVNMENLLSWNPDIVVMWYNEKKNPSDIFNDPQWRTVNAVKKGRVHEFGDVFHNDLWTLKFQYAVKTVAKWCHPEAFRHIDLEQEKKKMWHMLYERDSDILTRGKP